MQSSPPVIGITKEQFPGEKRVALIPAGVSSLTKNGWVVWVESGAGFSAGFTDADYEQHGAKISSRDEILSQSQVLLQVRALGANPHTGREELDALQAGHILIAFTDPLSEPAFSKEAADRNITTFSMELIPRITKAQSMDALSSMASIAGYKAVLMAAHRLPKMFPMMMTAAGTIAPAQVFVIGAGVAGLQAIATAKRLGAKVKAYDVRSVVKEQIESLGAIFVDIQAPETDSEDSGGYAKEQKEEFLQYQRQKMTEVIAESDVVITTAAVPGKRAPILVTREMVETMKPGSVLMDLAAERGGNCEDTRAGETVEKNGVQIVGTLNIPSTVPYHASQMYSKNISTFYNYLFPTTELQFDMQDEIVSQTLVTHQGTVVHPSIRKLLEMPPLPSGSDSEGGEH